MLRRLLLLSLGQIVPLGLAKQTTNLTVRADTGTSQLWRKYAENGLRYYNEWEQHTGPDLPFPSQLGDILSTDFDRKELPDREHPFLEELGYKITRGQFVLAWSTWPAEDAYAAFYNWISAEQGIFVLGSVNRYDREIGDETPSNNDGGSEDSEGEPSEGGGIIGDDGRSDDGRGTNRRGVDDGEADRPPFPYHLSQIVWWQWVQVWNQQERRRGRKHLRPWHLSPRKPDYSNLKTYYVEDAQNPKTKRVLDDVFQGHTLDSTSERPLQFRPNVENPEDPFWVLLGSPLFTGLIHMLKENKRAMRGKGVLAISVMLDEGENELSYRMWAILGWKRADGTTIGIWEP